MRIIESLKQTYVIPPSAVALGNFDGVHKGHQALIKKAADMAKAGGLASVCFTFTNLPANEIAGKCIVKNIMTLEEKIDAIERLGIDYLVCIPFDQQIMNMQAEYFAGQVLAGMLNCSVAVCGYNYNFGSKGAGDAAMLKQLGQRYGFEVSVMDEFRIEDQPVSSTTIRNFLDEGNVKAFEKFTGRKYDISGKVIEGQHLGTRMGYPTVNINLSSESALPKNGVYVSYIYVNGRQYKGVTNVGNKPTVGKFDKNAETHIFDFSEDIYGQDIRIEFADFLREERCFPSIEELEKQIAKDCESALHFNDLVL